MKNLALILAFAFISFGAFAQKRNDLKGPAFKNYKPGKNITEATNIYVSNNKASLNSLEYKNYKPWQDDNSEKASKLTAITSNEKKSKLRSYEYKNYKPWRNKRK
jgi:hypothetical protein